MAFQGWHKTGTRRLGIAGLFPCDISTQLLKFVIQISLGGPLYCTYPTTAKRRNPARVRPLKRSPHPALQFSPTTADACFQRFRILPLSNNTTASVFVLSGALHAAAYSNSLPPGRERLILGVCAGA